MSAADNSKDAVAHTAGGSATEMPLVHAVNVMKSFNDIPVLKGIDLDVRKGQVVCLLGPSGSGKTTFLRCRGHHAPPIPAARANRLSLGFFWPKPRPKCRSR